MIIAKEQYIWLSDLMDILRESIVLQLILKKRNNFGLLPPEVISEEKYTKVVNVYSFGIMAYE
ncbi:hypothetical protein Glove_106g22 [Diversispora epigaea]|uniref:Protein kinase domain-containing protein n=1 Tax=Diversispora epigaea TaxID=1348612 RepID=A0A397J9G9_9GLOM|nr:hypothetical protein Glove_106g22 [Diversispora epigaea]